MGTGQFLLRSGVITFSACRALMSMGGALKVDGKLGLRILGMGKMEDGNFSSKMGYLVSITKKKQTNHYMMS